MAGDVSLGQAGLGGSVRAFRRCAPEVRDLARFCSKDLTFHFQMAPWSCSDPTQHPPALASAPGPELAQPASAGLCRPVRCLPA